jgi:KDO2-lipid IV(A) lauroyltransferase
MRRPHPAYVAFRAGSAVARALPASAVPGAARLGGRLAARRMASRRLIVERNLRRVLGDDLAGEELDAAVERTFTSYAHYWLESFRLPGTSAEALAAGFDEVGAHHIDEALAVGRGAILAMPHLGAWEWAAFWLTAVRGCTVTAVVEQIEPPELADWFIGLRNEFGIDVVPFGPEAAAACARALSENQVLALLCDRDLAGTGIEVDLFGERTTLPGGPATLALRTGAALLPATCYFGEDGAHHGRALAPLDTERRGRLREDVTRVTQDIARSLEDLIRDAPDQWHLLQPNWPSDHVALAAAGLGPALPTPAPAAGGTGVEP